MTKEELLEIVNKAESEKRGLTPEEKALIDQALAEAETRAVEPEEKPEAEAEDTDEEKVDEKPQEEPEQEKEPEKEPEPEEKEDEPKNEDESENRNNINKSRMNTNFSIVRAIRSIANNQPLNDIDKAVIEEGRKQNRSFEAQGQIQIPMETRAAITVAAEGEDVVATELWDIMKPLRAKNVLVNAGARVYSGLVGNVQIPLMSKSSVTWEGETADAQDGAPSFTHIGLAPKRLTAYVEISKQMLAQDSVDVENAIREDLIAAVNAKLEETLLGVASGTTTMPEGMFYTLSAATATSANTVNSFAGIVNAEADVEDQNITGEPCYVMSNKAKAVLRAMPKSSKSTQLTMEGGEVDGTKAFSTSVITDKKYIFGDFSNLIIGQWAGLDITVDPYTLAGSGKIKLVVNMFVDAKVARPNAFVAKYVANA